MKVGLYANLLVAVLALTLLGGRAVDAQSSGAVVAVQQGWNLLAGRGSAISGLQGNIYTFQPGDTAYQVLPPTATLQAGLGYWINYPAQALLGLAAGSETAYRVTPRPGEFVMIGDPSGTQAAAVTGADQVLTYDSIKGYQQTVILQPGQGAWAVSAGGSTITVTPQGGQVLAVGASANALGTASTPLVASTTLTTFSSPMGYRFQAPSDWQQVPPPANSQTVDLVVQSPGGAAAVVVSVVSLNPDASTDPVQLLTSLLQARSARVREYKLVMMPQSTTSVRGADRAAQATYTYTDEAGIPYTQAIAIAVVRRTAYVMIVDLPTDAAQRSPSLLSSPINTWEITR